MKPIFISIIILAFAIFCAAPAFSADNIISVEEQKKRDTGKDNILRAEIERELSLIGEKTQLAAIAEAMQDFKGASSLKSEIEQHQLNISLLKKELEPSKGGAKKASTVQGTRQTAKAAPEKPETESVDTWNTYSRKPSISMF